MLIKLSAMAKAVVSAAAAGTATLAVATSDGSLSTGDVVTIVLAVLGALGVTYAVPNAKEEG
jgi:hypothetical protein